MHHGFIRKNSKVNPQAHGECRTRTRQMMTMLNSIGEGGRDGKRQRVVNHRKTHSKTNSGSDKKTA